MGRNFPSYRTYLRRLISELRHVERMVRDRDVASGIEKIITIIMNESGAISISSDPKIMQILVILAKILALVDRDD